MLLHVRVPAILSVCRQLNTGAARRLAEQIGFHDANEVQALWLRFLGESPWSVLLHSSLSSLLRFNQAFCPAVFSDSTRRTWRDRGLFSGVIDRMFTTLDVQCRGSVTFEQYLTAVFVLTRGSQQVRFKLAFQFFDLNGDQVVSIDEVHHTTPCNNIQPYYKYNSTQKR